MREEEANRISARLRTWVRTHREDVQLPLDRREIELLLDELQSLQRSNDLLRKQNDRLRRRAEELRSGRKDPGEDDLGEPGGASC